MLVDSRGSGQAAAGAVEAAAAAAEAGASAARAAAMVHIAWTFQCPGSLDSLGGRCLDSAVPSKQQRAGLAADTAGDDYASQQSSKQRRLLQLRSKLLPTRA